MWLVHQHHCNMHSTSYASKITSNPPHASPTHEHSTLQLCCSHKCTWQLVPVSRHRNDGMQWMAEKPKRRSHSKPEYHKASTKSPNTMQPCSACNACSCTTPIEPPAQPLRSTPPTIDQGQLHTAQRCVVAGCASATPQRLHLYACVLHTLPRCNLLLC
jgi:hypothetical protein